jgi:hypothetical protein
LQKTKPGEKKKSGDRNPRSTATAVKDKCRPWKKRMNHATVLKKLCVFYCSYLSLSLRKFSTWVVKQRKEGFDDVDERRMTEKDSLSLSLSLSLSVVSFELGFFIERGLNSGGESSWTLIFGEAILAQFFSWFFFFPCLFSDLPEFHKRCLFLLDLHSNIWYVLFLHWRLEELLGSNESVSAIRAFCLFGALLGFDFFWVFKVLRLLLVMQSILKTVDSSLLEHLKLLKSGT